jgi:hypothetical protein
MNESLSSWFKF